MQVLINYSNKTYTWSRNALKRTFKINGGPTVLLYYICTKVGACFIRDSQVLLPIESPSKK